MGGLGGLISVNNILLYYRLWIHPIIRALYQEGSGIIRIGMLTPTYLGCIRTSMNQSENQSESIPDFDFSSINLESMLYTIADLEAKGRQSEFYGYLHELLGMSVVRLDISRRMREMVKDLESRGFVRIRFSCHYPDGHRPRGRMTYSLTDSGKDLFNKLYGTGS